MGTEKDCSLGDAEKPAYFNKHACDGCDTGYIECAQFAGMGLKCCPDCDHPTRWSDPEPYTPDERAQMLEYHRSRS